MVRIGKPLIIARNGVALRRQRSPDVRKTARRCRWHRPSPLPRPELRDLFERFGDCRADALASEVRMYIEHVDGFVVFERSGTPTSRAPRRRTRAGRIPGAPPTARAAGPRLVRRRPPPPMLAHGSAIVSAPMNPAERVGPPRMGTNTRKSGTRGKARGRERSDLDHEIDLPDVRNGARTSNPSDHDLLVEWATVGAYNSPRDFPGRFDFAGSWFFASLRAMPMVASSSRMRSLSAKSLRLRAWRFRYPPFGPAEFLASSYGLPEQTWKKLPYRIIPGAGYDYPT